MWATRPDFAGSFDAAEYTTSDKKVTVFDYFAYNKEPRLVQRTMEVIHTFLGFSEDILMYFDVESETLGNLSKLMSLASKPSSGMELRLDQHRDLHPICCCVLCWKHTVVSYVLGTVCCVENTLLCPMSCVLCAVLKTLLCPVSHVLCVVLKTHYCVLYTVCCAENILLCPVCCVLKTHTADLLCRDTVFLCSLDWPRTSHSASVSPILRL